MVAEADAHGLAGAGITVISLSTSILIVLVFRAARDYVLCSPQRPRREPRRRAAAVAVALRRPLPALVGSAATVTVTDATLCLLMAESASLHGLGPVAAAGHPCSALPAQTTLLPALLLGRGAFWPQVPRPGEVGHEESGLCRIHPGSRRTA